MVRYSAWRYGAALWCRVMVPGPISLPRYGAGADIFVDIFEVNVIGRHNDQ
jgi:hypothetical protein